MKKIAVALAAIAVLVIAAVVVAPRVVDFDRYRQAVGSRIGAMIGRDVRIDGALRLAVLPSVGAVADTVVVGNIAGADGDFARIRTVEVQVAFWPLFTGRVELRTLRLVGPDIRLERFADGRSNWQFQRSDTTDRLRAEGGDGAPLLAGGDTAKARAGGLVLERIEIVDGTVTYVDRRADVDERIEEVKAQFRGESRDGPFNGRGEFRLRGVRTAFDVAAGRLDDDGTMPLQLIVSGEGGVARAELRGRLAAGGGEPQFHGRTKIEATTLATALRMITPRPLPGVLAQPLFIEGDVSASQTVIRAAPLTLRFGETSGSGTVTTTLGGAPTVDAEVALGRVDLDTWLAMASPPLPASSTESPRAGGGASPPPQHSASARPARATAKADRTPISGRFAVTAEALAYRGGLISQVAAAADLAGDRLTVRRLTAQTPGGGDLALSGMGTMAGSASRFDGTVEAKAADLRGLVRWLGADAEGVPPGYLRAFRLQGSIAADGEGVTGRKLTAQIDSSRVTGDIGLSFRAPRRLTVDLQVDRIDAGAFAAAAETAMPPPSRVTADAATPSEASERPRADTALVPRMAVADDGGVGEADVRLAIASLLYRGVPANDVVADGRFAGGDLDIRNLAIGDFAGASASLRGRIEAILTTPTWRDATIRFAAVDVWRLARAFDAEAGSALRRVGEVAGAATLAGALLTPRLDGSMRAAGADLGWDGQVAPIGFDGRATLRADTTRLLRALFGGYTPSGPLGGTDVVARVRAGGGRVALTDIDGRVAGVTASGTATIDVAAAKPKAVLDLSTGRLAVEPFLPARRAAALPAGVLPVAWRGAPGSSHAEGGNVVAAATAAVHRRWSRSPFDLAVLNAFDADLAIRFDSLSFEGFTLDEAVTAGTLTSGVLTISRFNGGLLGGTVRASGRIDTAEPPAFSTEVALDNVDLRRAPDGSSATVLPGVLSLDARLDGRGSSAAEIVSTLNGDGRLRASAVEVGAIRRGVSTVGELATSLMLGVQELNQLLLPFLRSAPRPVVDVTAAFTVNRGIVAISEQTLDSPLYSGRATGSIDLPAWTLDLNGTVVPNKGILDTLLPGIRLPTRAAGFSVRGSIDDPVLRLDATFLRGLPIPGLDQLRGRKGVGGILERVLPR